MADPIINIVDPKTFEFQEYSNSDSQLIVQSELDTSFSASTDYIEYYVYDQNDNQIYPSNTIPLLDYEVLNGDIILNPESNISDIGFTLGTYNIIYNFFRKRLNSNNGLKYFISNISSDRKEIRLDSNLIPNELIISSSNSFINYREESTYFVDFYLNFGNNQTVIANNLKLETEEGIDPTVLVKLYEPLPNNFNVKDELWVVEEISQPQAYQVIFPFEPIIEDDFTYISGPNFNLNVTQETSKGGKTYSFSTLLESNVTSSVNQIKSLLNEKEININVNYENYANFVHFSSAKTRLENFVYKVGLIESSSKELTNYLGLVTSNTINTQAYSSSKAQLTSTIDNIIENFDGYEYFLYFNSGSLYSYPKINDTPPYRLALTESVQAKEWVGSALVGDTYYGGQALSASNHDQDNRDWLYWSIPEYLRDDPDNQRYELFVDMVGQYYDNVWLYTKDLTNKFDADNRLEFGISKDLVADAIRDFSVKLYSNNFNTDDLFTAFLGLTPSGSAFPFPNITGSVVDGSGDLSIPSGFEYVDTEISASNDIVPLSNVQKQVYKRIYHNIPYLLKTKGTIAGIRALITSYGIPDTILRISEFGGKDRNEAQDYDLKQDVFNYAFDTGTGATNFLTSSFRPNSKFNPKGKDTDIYGSPNTIQFRFKPARIPTASNNVASSNIRYSQSLWLSDNSSNIYSNIATAVVLEYTGSGFVTGSYSGSVASPYDTWGTLKFYPDLVFNPTVSCSVFAPFFNEDWWSVQLTVTGSGTTGVTGSLFSANEIDGKIGFSGSEFKTGLDSRPWYRSDFAALNIDSNKTLNSKVYKPFSGSFQEYRMFIPRISESKFFDYTVNPYSNEGNTINSTPDELMFRAALGSQLDTGSRTSIHPRVTGSAVQITQSFNGDTSDYFIRSARKLFVTNVEDIFQDQVPAGIKNRITNKLHAENLILAEAPYGYQTPTSSNATISSTTSDVVSPMESIQQHSFVSQSYTPNVNYLEVAFSPSNQINDDINAQLGYFNLGDYIGDPRFLSSSAYSYPDLDRLRDAYFEKYIKGYDIVDFVRLIKFFDNSLFKMIKDFTPARTSLASGVVVKQHLLERNRQRQALVSSSFHNYSGSVKPFPKNYNTGSFDQPQYATSGSAIYKFTGGPGGSFNKYNGLKSYLSGSLSDNPWFNNRFKLTQSWSESFDKGVIEGSVLNTTYFNQSSSQYISGSYLGRRTGVIHDDQSEFYNGIFSGSYIEVEDGILNPGCGPYLNVNDTPILYRPIFFSDTNSPVITRGAFLDQNNYPPTGTAWILSTQTNQGGSGNQQVINIKLNQSDVNGVEVIEYLDDENSIRFLFSDAVLPYLGDFNISATEYKVTGRTVYSNFILLEIDISTGNGGNNFTQTIDGVEYIAITSSKDGGSENWSLQLQTSRTIPSRQSSGAITSIISSLTASNDLQQQNVFLNPESLFQEQIIYDWVTNGWDTAPPVINDALGFFNIGSGLFASTVIPNGSQVFNNASYNPPYTPNIPLFFTASIRYSASFDAAGGSNITASGILHESSSYQGSITDQSFTLSSAGPVANSKALYVNTNGGSGFSTSNLAAAATPPTPSSNDQEIFNNDELVALSTGQNIFDDAGCTTPTALNIGGVQGNPFYLVADASGNLAVFNLLQVFNGNRAISTLTQLQQNKLVWVTGAPPAGGSLFRPSPRLIDLNSDTVFRSTYNTQIPGNSGSNAGVDGGHPKLLVPGTASLQFSASRLTLAGTPPTLNPPASSYTFLSGSSITFPNGNVNDDFTATFANGLYIDWYPSSGTTGDEDYGAVGVDYEELANWAEGVLSDQGNSGYDHMPKVKYTNPSFNVKAYTGHDSSVVDTSANFTASIYFQQDTDQTSPTSNWTQWPGTEVNANNGTAELSGISQIINSFPYNSPTPVGVFRFAILMKSPNPIDYRIKGFQVTVYPIMSTNTSIPSPAFNIPTALMISDNSYAQGSSTNTQQFTASFNATTSDRYNRAQVDIYLRVTGSNGAGITYDRVITSSVYDDGTNGYPGTGSTSQGYSGSVYPGVEIPFTFADIEAFHPNPSAANTTVNSSSDMYYVEYSMSNFVGGIIGGIIQTSQLFDFQTNSDESIVRIGQRTGIDGGSTFNLTGSVRVRKTNTFEPTAQTDPLIAADGGDLIIDESWIPEVGANATDIKRVELSGSYSGFFNAGDVYRFSTAAIKAGGGSGLVITSITASLLPSESIWTDGFNPPSAFNNFDSPTNTGVIISDYFGANVLPFSLALDCQPLLNNYNIQRPNSYLMDVDYDNTSGPVVPVNFEQIIENTAVRAGIPDSNYTQLQTINPRYNGSKTTSKFINIWSIGDTNTFGKKPTVELRDAFFGYFNDLSDPYPNINGLTQVNLNYLIDENGNALPPSLNQISIDTFDSVFPKGTDAKLAIKKGNSQYKGLGNPAEVKELMSYVAPIMYTQNSSNNYSPYIPLSGSGYISRYDNGDADDKVFASFMAGGDCTVNTNTPVTSIDYLINPQGYSGSIPENKPSVIVPYTGSTGKAEYIDTRFGPVGSDTEQVITLQTSVITTYVSETRGTRDELKIALNCYTGSTDFTGERSYNLESIDAKVYTETGQVYLIKDVDDYGWFTYENIETTTRGSKRVFNIKEGRWRWSRIKVPTGGIRFFVDWEMYDTLWDRGIIRKKKPKNSSPITGIEWIFSINTGNLPIKQGDKVHFRMQGEFKDTRGESAQGFFFPDAYEGAKASAKIQGQGVYDHLLDTDNTGSAPFWKITGSTGGYNNFLDTSILVMASPNINEAYGTGFYQGYIPYYPGPSQYFPGGVEPEGTDFDEIQYPLEIQEGDEIRFGNNENFTYRIEEVFAPQENIESDGKPRLKIRINGNIPVGATGSSGDASTTGSLVNLDFFLVRRPIVTPNTLYLNQPFPYESLASASISQQLIVSGSSSFALTSSNSLQNIDGSGNFSGSFSSLEIATTPGILYPDFPTEYLIQSASIIVNDLISKGIIES